MNRYPSGLLIGKFYPPHVGHHALIRWASSRCDRLTVLVMAGATETVPLADRMAWMRAEHHDDHRVRILGTRCDAPMDVTDEQVWTAQLAIMRAALGTDADVDAVFCGDSYGPELARRFSATAVPVERTPSSSTAIRADLAGRWSDLAPATRAGLTTRVVVLGAESTGTTTVARALAEHYRARGGAWAATTWVPEYGREHTEAKWAEQPGRLDEVVWNTADFDAIAVEQTRREEAAARHGSPLLVCDTDAFATAIWERRYLGAHARTGQPWTQVPPRAVYLVTDHVGVPWSDDGMREGDLAIRSAMTGWFVDALTRAGHSWVPLTGTLDQRVDLAVRTVDPLLDRAARFGEPLHGPGFEGQTA
ncbi:AAA family ATPase [Mycolicibacterium sediminis]|uniref:Transcriptional regulator NadR n=1 Tax=Mycolicibacterium sediminis TaxID=1286180 RepID=A0A7I7QZR5_9MYCO|nr:AAA family ATPase [Mycolicibacterium sediminis]BBY31893.1 transcriptional regulator NadR [Mycolicibacterium sediminis]